MEKLRELKSYVGESWTSLTSVLSEIKADAGKEAQVMYREFVNQTSEISSDIVNSTVRNQNKVNSDEDRPKVYTIEAHDAEINGHDNQAETKI